MGYSLVETQFPYAWSGGKNASFIGSLWERMKQSSVLYQMSETQDSMVSGSVKSSRDRTNLVVGMSRQLHLSDKESSRLSQGEDGRRKGCLLVS